MKMQKTLTIGFDEFAEITVSEPSSELTNVAIRQNNDWVSVPVDDIVPFAEALLEWAREVKARSSTKDPAP